MVVEGGDNRITPVSARGEKDEGRVEEGDRERGRERERASGNLHCSQTADTWQAPP